MQKDKITIKDLRQNGFKVRVIHTDPYTIPHTFDVDEKALDLSKIGTCIEIRDPEGVEHRGVALCSKADNWNRKLGNKIALGRALKTVPDDWLNKITTK